MPQGGVGVAPAEAKGFVLPTTGHRGPSRSGWPQCGDGIGADYIFMTFFFINEGTHDKINANVFCFDMAFVCITNGPQNKGETPQQGCQSTLSVCSDQALGRWNLQGKITCLFITNRFLLKKNRGYNHQNLVFFKPAPL